MKTLRRSRTQRVFGGVAGGIAEYFNLDPVLIRFAFVICAFLGGGGVLLYIIGLIIMPERKPGDDIEDAKIVSDEAHSSREETHQNPKDDIKDNLNNLKNDFKDASRKVGEQVKDTVDDIKKNYGEKYEKEAKRMQRRSGWLGFFLIFIGVLFLLRIFGRVHFFWFDLIRLWPVVIVMLGVALIPMKSWLRSLLYLVCFVCALFLLFGGNGSCSHEYRSETTYASGPLCADFVNVEVSKSVSHDGEIAKMEVDAGACTLVFSDTTDKLSQVWINDREIVGQQSHSEWNNKTTSKFKVRSNVSANPNISVALNPSPIWDLELNVGAASVNMDLSAFKVKEVDVNSGAASIDLKLGEACSFVNVDIETGASSITVRIPKNAECKLVSESFLVSKDLPGFTKSGSGVYLTENYGHSTQTIVIDIEGAVSGFEIVRY